MTRKDVIKKLESEGVDLGKSPDRRITELVSKGLIRRPIRYGMGKGKGFRIEFDDSVVDEIKEVVRLRKEGLTYEQIKYKKFELDDWLALVNKIKSMAKTDQDAIDVIRKFPVLSDVGKGQVKLISDLAERIGKVVVRELKHTLSKQLDQDIEDYLARKARDINQDFIATTVFYYLKMEGTDYAAYLEDKNLMGKQVSCGSKRGHNAHKEGGK